MTAILEIENLEVNFRGFRAVDGFDMSVEEGELRVLIGANGAGKTTLMDLITGRTKSTGGKVTFLGDNITNRQEHKIARRGIGRKFQVPSVFKDLTVRENLEVAYTRSPSVWRNLTVRAKPRRMDQRIERALELASLTEESANLGRQPLPRADAVAGARHGSDAEPQARSAGRAHGRHDGALRRKRPPRSSTA